MTDFLLEDSGITEDKTESFNFFTSDRFSGCRYSIPDGNQRFNRQVFTPDDACKSREALFGDRRDEELIS